ncbi:hypothetical protein [Streptomyces sp. NPDC005953]|uniref:hypothetical protein n=1 Tax=Streptomyces sp. NPDC005953 TaxID=3156719 RepID=UPI0033F31AB8
MSVMRGAIVTAIREQYGVSVPGVRLPEASSAGVTGLIPARDRGAGQWKTAADLADVLLDNHQGATGRAYLDAGRLFACVLHPHYSQVHLDKLLKRLGDSRPE